MKTLVLFDLDDTLVGVHDIHVEAFRDAFLKVYGADASIDEIYHAGLTVQNIMERVLEEHGVYRDEVLGKLNEAVDIMAAHFEKKKIAIKPGIKKLLARLSKNKEIILGVATGLVEKIAMIILKNAKLDKFFEIMSFGDGTDYRREVIEKAVAKAMTARIVIIGDSIHDVEMAKVFNAKSIAAATGSTSREQLKEENPDFLFDDLSDTEKVMKAILK
jgi:phosphoglycolate phosphatase-like HAD superfamily hydrolase